MLRKKKNPAKRPDDTTPPPTSPAPAPATPPAAKPEPPKEPESKGDDDSDKSEFDSMSLEQLKAEAKKAKYEAGKFRLEKKELKEKIDAFEKEKSDAEAAKLKEEGKHKEHAEKVQKDFDEYKKKSEQRVISSELKAELVKAGVKDPIVAKLIDASKLSLDSDGEVKGISEAIAEFKKEHPDFFKTEADKTKQVNPTGLPNETPSDGAKGKSPTAMDKDKDGNYILQGAEYQKAMKAAIGQK